MTTYLDKLNWKNIFFSKRISSILISISNLFQINNTKKSSKKPFGNNNFCFEFNLIEKHGVKITNYK